MVGTGDRRLQTLSVRQVTSAAGSNLLVIATDDPVVARSLRRLATEPPLEFRDLDDAASWESVGGAPLGMIVDLADAGVLDLVRSMKEAWPSTLVAGYLTIPDPDRWRRAEDAGCDLVASRGSLAKALVARLPAWRLNPGGRRLRLLPTADLAGRIGVVLRLEDSPVGPLALYHVGGEVCAAQDRCPHAGATLSGGEVGSDGIVTCPEHGSRFEVCSGKRIRGPADDGLETYRVEMDGSDVYLRL